MSSQETWAKLQQTLQDARRQGQNFGGAGGGGSPRRLFGGAAGLLLLGGGAILIQNALFNGTLSVRT